MNSKVTAVNTSYIQEYCVRMYESDHLGRLRTVDLLNYFQDSASDHAEKLGAGVIELMKRNLTWLLSRYHVKVFRYPRWRDSVELTTWPCAIQGLFALREFELRDTRKELLAAATSSWMLIDLKSKRPVVPTERLGSYPQNPQRAVVSSFEALPTFGEADLERSFAVRMSDLDWNRHVNHVTYIGWALETSSPDLLGKHRPTELEVDFRGQAFYGETVICRRQSLSPGMEPTILYQIVKEENRQELARLKITWRA